MRDLGLIAFFFLLRVGEYTTTKSKKRNRTKNFRAQGLSFQRNGIMLNPKGDLSTLLTVTGAILGSCVHHHAIEIAENCPIMALSRRVNHI